ncbi:MAG: zinc-binding alcohol dehydrogenase family protein [Salinigranum sp.]
MLAARFHDQRGLDSLRVEEVDRPTPGPNEAVVAVGAASVNAIDGRVLAGEFEMPTLPAILGGDLAGTVEAVGPGVSAFEPGDRVFGTPMSLDPRGTFAEDAVVPAERLAPLPDSIAFETATAAASVGSTAYHCLIELAGLRPGETCLVHGASGGVGHLAVQLAAASGARVIGTAGSAAARERVREFGADVALDYGAGDLEDEIAAAAPDGVDVVLDHRLGEYLPVDLAVAATGCRIVAIQGDVPAASGAALRNNAVALYGRSGETWTDRREFLSETLVTLLESGTLTPAIQAVYDLADVVEAERAMAEERVAGKLVVRP